MESVLRAAFGKVQSDILSSLDTKKIVIMSNLHLPMSHYALLFDRLITRCGADGLDGVLPFN